MLYDSGMTIYRSEPGIGSLLKRRNTSDDGGSDGDGDGEDDAGLRYKQAYRVLATAGGVPLRIGLKIQINADYPPPLESGSLRSVKHTYSAFRVACYRISYDTIKWVPIHDIVEFDPFEGEVDIASLIAFPIRESNQVWNKVRERNENFVKMKEISHWTHDGPTLSSDCNRQHVGNPVPPKLLHSYIYFQVNGPVIVDFKLAAQGGHLKLPQPYRDPLEAVTAWAHSRKKGIVEIYRRSHAKELNTSPACDVYMDIQLGAFRAATAELAGFLEYLNKVNLDGTIDDLIKLLHDKGYIMLLPGVTTAYALRNRKWGTSPIHLKSQSLTVP